MKIKNIKTDKIVSNAEDKLIPSFGEDIDFNVELPLGYTMSLSKGGEIILIRGLTVKKLRGPRKLGPDFGVMVTQYAGKPMKPRLLFYKFYLYKVIGGRPVRLCSVTYFKIKTSLYRFITIGDDKGQFEISEVDALEEIKKIQKAIVTFTSSIIKTVEKG